MNRLFDRYNSELTFIRELAKDFAARFPGVADRLLLDEQAESKDPHVERMIEAFALLTANVQVKLEDEFPELTEAMLQVLYPHYLAPLPSMAIVQFVPNPGAADNPDGYTLPAGTELQTAPIQGVPCRYRTGYPVTIWPIEITSAKLREPPYEPQYQPPAALRNEIQCYLKLSLRCTGGVPFEQLNLERLRLHLLGTPQDVAALYETLFTECRHVEIYPRSPDAAPSRCSPADFIRPVGFDAAESLLPYPRQAFNGYRLLSEFFAYPARFAFIDLAGWSDARRNGLRGTLAEVLFFFDRPPRDGLVQAVQKSTFAVGCAPVVNLFDMVAEGIHLNYRKSEYPVIPDVNAIHAYEIYSVDDVHRTDRGPGRTADYRPFYSFRHGEAEAGPYWYPIRRPRLVRALDGGDDAEGSSGTDVSLRLIDLDLDPYEPADGTLVVKTTCLNRDLPKLLQAAGRPEMTPRSAAPVQVRCLRPPTPTVRPALGRRSVWRLMSHLNLNVLSLGDAADGRPALQEYLRLYVAAEGGGKSAVPASVVDGLVALRTAPAVAFTGAQVAGGYARGLAVTIELNDEKFAGVGTYLFASVLERFLALYVSINSFTQLTALSSRAGTRPWTWSPRGGTQQLL